MKKFIIAIIVIAVIAGMIFFNMNKGSDTPVLASNASSRNATPVKAATIETGDIYSYVTAPGRVEEVNKAYIFFDTPLRVLEVCVEKNKPVQKGDKLVKLDTTSLVEEMDRLKVQKEIQSITLKKLESGQSLLSLENQLTSAKNTLGQAQESHQEALNELQKQQQLYETGLIPKTQLEQYERSVKDAKKAVDTAQLNVDSAQKSYESSVEGQDLDIQAQIKNIELLGSQVADIEKKLNKIRNLEKAPIDGYVTEVQLSEGGYTVSGQPAFTIIDTQNLQITATVNEYNSRYLAPGKRVNITGDALGDNTELSGEIIAVAPIATSLQTSNGLQTVVEVIINPIDEQEILKPGLNVDCDIITQEKNGVVVAEFNIFMDDKDRQYVMAIDEETMTLKKQYVTQGIYSDMTVEIVNGLKAGDKVVIDPQPSMKDGDRVRIME